MPQLRPALAAPPLAVALVALATQAAAAQRAPRRPAREHPPVGLVTVSPVHLLFGAFAADAELAVRRDVTLGLQASYAGANNFTGRPRRGATDREATAVARYYLGPSAPFGTALGLSGWALIAERTRTVNGVAERREVTVPTVGLSLDFNQQFGSAGRLVLGTGTGVRRRLVGERREAEGVSEQQWTFRLNLGYAF